MLHLGADLIYAAVFASRSTLHSLEYASVIAVGSVVSVFGFVKGQSVDGGITSAM